MKELLVIGTKWCPLCSDLRTFLKNNPEYLKDLSFRYVDAETPVGKVAEDLSVNAYPASFIFDNFRQLSRLDGYTEDAFKEFLDVNTSDLI